jgi:hypothetical protein
VVILGRLNFEKVFGVVAQNKKNQGGFCHVARIPFTARDDGCFSGFRRIRRLVGQKDHQEVKRKNEMKNLCL